MANLDITQFERAISCTYRTLHDDEDAIASILSGILVGAISAG